MPTAPRPLAPGSPVRYATEDTRFNSDLHPQLRLVFAEADKRWKERYPTESQPFNATSCRSATEQNRLFANSRNGKDDDGDGRIDEADEWRTNAKGGQSPHNYYPSFARDTYFKHPKTPGQLDTRSGLMRVYVALIKEVAKEYGVRVSCGLDWPRKVDPPHIELADWRSLVAGVTK